MGSQDNSGPRTGVADKIAKAKLQDIQCSVKHVLNGNSYYTESNFRK